MTGTEDDFTEMFEQHTQQRAAELDANFTPTMWTCHACASSVLDREHHMQFHEAVIKNFEAVKTNLEAVADVLSHKPKRRDAA